MGFSDEILMAYADEELDPAQRAAVEQAMAADPEIARRLAEHTALRARLRQTYEPVLREEIPEQLLQALRGRPAGQGENVIPLRRGAQRVRGSSWQWIAIAASFLLGVIIGPFAVHLGAGGSFATRDGQLLARGALADALSHQLASTQNPRASVQMGVSYLAKNGEYCRSFTLRDRGNLVGLACRDLHDWQVQMLVQATEQPPGGTEYRRAASSVPEAISQTVENQIQGEPLDAPQEAAARSKGWSRQPSR